MATPLKQISFSKHKQIKQKKSFKSAEKIVEFSNVSECHESETQTRWEFSLGLNKIRGNEIIDEKFVSVGSD